MVPKTVAQNERRFYVYVIFRLNGEPCYVGKGQRNRWKAHGVRSHNKHLASIYALASGNLPAVKIREGLNSAEACVVEMALISALGRYPNGPLVNMTDGGEGVKGHVQSAQTRAKKRAALLGRARPPHIAEIMREAGKNRSPEWREKQRTSHLGHIASEETRRRQSIAQLARHGKTPADVVKRPKQTRSQRSEALSRRNLGNKYGLGNKRTPEGQERSRAAVAAANRLRIATPEYRELRRAIAKRMWAERRKRSGQETLPF